jgi:hypothetical protein
VVLRPPGDRGDGCLLSCRGAPWILKSTSPLLHHPFVLLLFLCLGGVGDFDRDRPGFRLQVLGPAAGKLLLVPDGGVGRGDAEAEAEAPAMPGISSLFCILMVRSPLDPPPSFPNLIDCFLLGAIPFVPDLI